VHRLLTALIALSLVSLQAQSLAFHTHAVADEHADHDVNRHDHHGPELHHHSASDTDLHVDEPDAATATAIVTVVVPAATVVTHLVLHIASAAAPFGSQRQDARRVLSVVTRSHDPPERSQLRFRGPPTSIQS
jgi:hypothetical protein